jgi:hypothetical protein
MKQITGAIFKIKVENTVKNSTGNLSGGQITGEHITVYLNGEEIYSQFREMIYNTTGTETFVNEFLKRFYSRSGSDKTSRDTCDVVSDGGDLFYFISKRRLKSLDFKKKFFYFLLKHLFLSGKIVNKN